ncbi:MAG: peptidylprolyl isomerase [Acidobacteria bacterium]|jgi:uncharacterized protein (TIGR03437 family)|nr:peptidylprolyl isomerase [Bryobacteraceae bacterium CoA2 C42]
MMQRMALAVAGGLWAASGLWAQLATGPTVRFNTSLGEIDVLLLPGSAPATVQNFLNYVRRGTYNNSIFHRSVPGFIIQGGGFTFSSGTFRALAADPPVRNEFRTSNSRGTIAMAKLGNNPNSATNQWFFNLANNASNLDNQNGGFTVFGRITNGLANMDRIAATPVFRLNSAELTDIPLLNFRSGQTVTESNVVFVRSITILDETPVPEISPNGVISAGNFGGMPFAAPGSYIEIYGNNLAGDVSRGWNTADFAAGAAPQTLENVRVTAGGQLAFVNFVSKNQINVQLPASLPVGGNVDIVVTNRNEQSAAYSLPVRALAPGLLAPASFKVGDKQFVATVRSTDGSFVTAAAPAKPGELLLFYGVGFGPVNPATVPIAGRVVEVAATVTAPVVFEFGAEKAEVIYAGLAGGLVGVYQFNVRVPAGVPDGDTVLKVSVNGEATGQNLFIPVRAGN